MFATRVPPRGYDGQRSNPVIWLESLDHGFHAIMAGKSGRRTRQGFGYPKSAAGQGEKAGPHFCHDVTAALH